MNKVKIYRDGKRYFYTYQNETKEIDEISLNKLQTKLKLPFEIIFCNSISLAQRQKIMGRFISEGVNFQIGLTENDEYKVIDAEDASEIKLRKLEEGDQILVVNP